MDWYVLLAPLLALVVVVLLGYTGCEFTGQGSGASLLLRLRVPATIPVTLCRYRHRPPLMNETVSDVTEPRDENGNKVYEHYIFGPIDGTWTVTLRLEATNPGGSTVVRADQDRELVLPVEGAPNVVATWETVGMPGQGQAYQLVYRDLLPE